MVRLFAAVVRSLRCAFLTDPFRVTKPIRRPRLGVEGLEDRDVPATFYWVGDVDQYYYKAANWTQSADPANKPDAPSAPPPGSDVRFDGRYGSADCYWGNGPGQHEGLRVVGGYGGTVQLGVTVTVEELDVQCGKIDQAASAILTVTSLMNWTGGELDTTPATPSQVVVTGIGTVANILPREGTGTGSVQTADTIKIVSGAEARFGYGTVQFNAGGLEVSDYAKAYVVADGTKKLALTRVGANNTASVKIGPNGWYSVERATPDSDIPSIHSSQLPFQIVAPGGSALEIGGGIHMQITGRFPNSGPSLSQSGGQVRQTGGSTLQVTGGYTMTGGMYTGVINAADTTIDIDGDMRVNGTDAEVRFQSVTGQDYYGTLQVLGTVTWTSGKYRPRVTAGAGGLQACLWKATGQFTIGAGAAVIAPFEPGQVAAGDAWTILEGGGLTGTPAAPNGYTVPKVGNELRLVKS